jgi:hypothetical protein
MMNLTTAADEVKLRQSEISKDYHAYSVPKAAHSEHVKPREGIIPRFVHFVTSSW